mmetsp:Transcript_34064/g.98188  ORF Transcript_34064/g.98188 Transcript_34064/m.98188 type:complete len:332 (-) Transcript_34064:849-1844(-)
MSPAATAATAPQLAAAAALGGGAGRGRVADIDPPEALQVSEQRLLRRLLLGRAGAQSCDDLLEGSWLNAGGVAGTSAALADRQAVGDADHVCRLQGRAKLQAAAGEDAVELVVEGASLVGEAVVEGERSVQVPALDAALQQACVNVGVRAALVVVLDNLESLVQHAGITHRLNQNAQGAIRGRNPRLLHLAEQLQGILHTLLLRISIHDRAVHGIVGRELALGPHLLQGAQGALHIALCAVALDDRREGEHIRLGAGGDHVLKQGGDTVHLARLRADVNDRVKRGGGEQRALLSHRGVDSNDTVDVTGARETFEQRREHRCLDHATALRTL